MDGAEFGFVKHFQIGSKWYFGEHVILRAEFSFVKHFQIGLKWYFGEHMSLGAEFSFVKTFKSVLRRTHQLGG